MQSLQERIQTHTHTALMQLLCSRENKRETFSLFRHGNPKHVILLNVVYSPASLQFTEENGAVSISTGITRCINSQVQQFVHIIAITHVNVSAAAVQVCPSLHARTTLIMQTLRSLPRF